MPGTSQIGATNIISDGLNAYRPQAAFLIPTETPFNSMGSAGARLDSDALPLLTVTLAGGVPGLAKPCTKANSPGASPPATPGVGLPVGDGLGDGLTLGLGLAVGLATG